MHLVNYFGLNVAMILDCNSGKSSKDLELEISRRNHIALHIQHHTWFAFLSSHTMSSKLMFMLATVRRNILSLAFFPSFGLGVTWRLMLVVETWWPQGVPLFNSELFKPPSPPCSPCMVAKQIHVLLRPIGVCHFIFMLKEETKISHKRLQIMAFIIGGKKRS